MPIYVYQADDDENACEFCKEGFEFMPRTNDVVLERCPRCRTNVHRVISAVNAISSERELLGDANLSKKGFAIYEKTDEGVYERTVGESGPKIVKT